jgi:hypothetical protein
MTRTLLRAFVAGLGGVLALACGGDKGGGGNGDAGGGGSTTGTWTEVSTKVMTQQSCGGPLCHTLTAGGFTLSSPDQLYNELVNAPASGKFCGPNAIARAGDAGATAGDGGKPVYIRVVPGDPDKSLLYLKLAGHPPCGDPMPATGALDAAKVEIVRSWIAAGAKKD